MTQETIRIRHLLRPGTWPRLSLLEKIAVIQLTAGLVTLALLVLLVVRS